MTRYILPFAVLLPSTITAQDIFFRFTNGATVTHAVTEVRSTDFVGGSMRVFLWNGTTYTWDLSDLDRYQFNDITTAMDGGSTDPHPLVIYPNPTIGGVRIGFTVNGPGSVKVELLDMRGSVVHAVYHGTLTQGGHDLYWDGRDAQGQPVANGNYLIRVEQGLRIVTQQVIVQR
jgi:hypothetical protein